MPLAKCRLQRVALLELAPNQLTPSSRPASPRGLQKSHLQHHLLRGRDLHGIHDRACHPQRFLRPAWHDRPSPRRRQATNNNLPVNRRDAKVLVAGAGPDLLLQAPGIEHDFKVEHADQPRIAIEQ